ncbi:hypothetical protein FPSE_05685 [Fusarium pseudograminearum CS3096]|uniref:RING-type domain-containing protein n=1 Tax=Fusarium pseudograminearum (strain CS3096) TaxID=1028729 RepID=K3UP98_FUSPC|nr:hypothetical protein FPSE_05685 [Fusarium pseudograminearum CS3096]EKJ74146.1 hypothetical protein FPSE_05685 [Fusarium pseudograminearum CS3096]
MALDITSIPNAKNSQIWVMSAFGIAIGLAMFGFYTYRACRKDCFKERLPVTLFVPTLPVSFPFAIHYSCSKSAVRCSRGDKVRHSAPDHPVFSAPGPLSPLFFTFCTIIISMAQSEDSDTIEHTNNDNQKTTVWAAILCVVIIVIIAAICIVHRNIRGQAIRRSIEAQLPRYNVSSGLGKDTVESMPIIRFDSRLHSQQIAAPARVYLPPFDQTKPRKHGAQLLPLRKYFTIQNICRESPRSDGAGVQPGDSTSTACSICTEDFIEGVKLRMLPCRHLYHPQCIDPWLTNRSRTCPLWDLRTKDPASGTTTVSGLSGLEQHRRRFQFRALMAMSNEINASYSNETNAVNVGS